MPLLARDRRAIAMDTIGYGDSYRPRTQPSIEDYAEAVVSLLDGLDINAASIMGRHTGALTAIEVAAAYPERLDKLILYGPPYVDEEVAQQLPGVTTNLDWRVKEDGSHLTELWNDLKEGAMRRGWSQVPPHFVNRLVLAWLKPGEMFAAFGRNAVSGYTYMTERLKMVQCPTLIIWGDYEVPGVLTEERRPVISRLIARNRAVEVGGGPFGPNRIADEIAPLVLDFLANPGI